MAETREQFQGKPIYSLTEISQSLRAVISKNYPHPYYVKAEIVKLNYYPHSGHCYPELAEKEDNKIKTQMRAIIWSSQFRDINSRFQKITGEPLKESINILCLATIEYDVKYGLSLHIQDIEPTYTVGDMFKNKMLVIDRLKKEGIFNANKERKLAILPKRIAVISVETSKGYGDFLVTLKNNLYHFQFSHELFPSILQGEKAILTITERLEEIRGRMEEFDSVVIIRGGGGDVGLSCYDDYRLAAAVAMFPLPVIAGIGHATNVTVTDMVAYQSKITPTDVANFYIDRFREFNETIDEIKEKITRITENMLKEAKNSIKFLEQNRNSIASKITAFEKQKLQQIENDLKILSMKVISDQNMRMERLNSRIKMSYTEILYPKKDQVNRIENLIRLFCKQLLHHKKEEIENMEQKIALLNPDHILKRGFSITYFHNKAIFSEKELKQGDKIVTKFHQGEIESEVTQKIKTDK